MHDRRANVDQGESQAAFPTERDYVQEVSEKLDRLLEQAAAGNRRFLTVTDAARYAGLSEESIRRMLRSRKLTGLRPVPGRVLIDRRQLDAVILASVRQLRKGRGLRAAASLPSKAKGANSRIKED